MSVSIKTRQAYSEIDEFLELLNQEQREKIPKKLREIFKEQKDKTYYKKIDTNIPIKDQNLKEETLAIIALLNLQYWCKDQKEKDRLQTIYAENEKKYQEELYNKYNTKDIFKKNNITVENNNKITQKNQMIEYKDSMLKKFLKIILKALHLK